MLQSTIKAQPAAACVAAQQAAGGLARPLHPARGPSRRRGSGSKVAAVASQQQLQQQKYPDFVPHPFALEVEEPAAREMMARMRRVEVQVPSLGAVATAYVGPQAPEASTSGGASSSADPVLVLLHGFDSSSLEFRRFAPLLQQQYPDTYCVDLAGWGFTDYSPFAEDPELALGPVQKREHLAAFLEQVAAPSGRPVVLVGTSLGGAVALDFALHNPQAVDALVLIDAQGFIDGIGPLASMPRWLAGLGVQVLRSVPLRQAANKMAYHDTERYATDDAMRIGRLHTHTPGWQEANVAFMRSGGYALSSRIQEVQTPTLVVWGRQDQILDPKYAGMFMEALPNARLQWVDACGHCAHLEQPAALLDAVAAFVAETTSSDSDSDAGARRGTRQPAAAAAQ